MRGARLRGVGRKGLRGERKVKMRTPLNEKAPEESGVRREGQLTSTVDI